MAMIEHPVPYEYDGEEYQGMLVYNDGIDGKRPAIFMQPDWLGVCPHTIEMAAEAMGDTDYVILLADMFGKNYGGMQKTNAELGPIARGKRSDIEFILGCGAAADKALTAEADRLGLIDRSRIGAVGYCMGGGFLTEQIRAGAPYKGSIFIHVTLPMTVAPNRPSDIKGRVLIVHGTADIVTPVPQVDSFETELTMAGIDWQTMMFGGAPHGFCVRDANDNIQRYDQRLCDQTYRLMRDFFDETL